MAKVTLAHYIHEKTPLNELKRLYTLEGWTVKDIRSIDPKNLTALCNGMINGQLDIVKWLVHQFGMTIEDVRADHNVALQAGIGNGQLECVKWLVSNFRLTVEDVRQKGLFDQNTLFWAIQNNQLESAKWLVNYFGLTVEDARNSLPQGKYNDFETIAWIIFWFGLDENLETLDIDNEDRDGIKEELYKLRCQRMIKASYI